MIFNIQRFLDYLEFSWIYQDQDIIDQIQSILRIVKWFGFLGLLEIKIYWTEEKDPHTSS